MKKTCVVEGLRRQAGADDIDAIGRRLDGDLGGLACEAESGIGDVEIEVLGHPRVKWPDGMPYVC